VAVTGQFLMSLDDNSAQSSYSASPTNCPEVDHQAANPRARRNTNGGNNEGPARDLSAFLVF
jgi:hypothetical protein